MNDQSFTSKLLEIIEGRRSSHGLKYSPAKLAVILGDRKLTPQQDEIPEAINLLTRLSGHRGDGSPIPIPPVLPDAITTILSSYSANTVLDPWAGLGGLLSIAQQATSAGRCIGYNINSSEAKLAGTFFPQAEWSTGQSLNLLQEVDEEIDVVVSCLPFSAGTNGTVTLINTAGKSVKLKDRLGSLILAAAVAKLSDNGIGLFIVTPSFFLLGRSVLKHFPDLGFSVEAAFALPPGSFAPYASIGAYLLVVRKSANKKMFVAQLSSDQNTNVQIFRNYTKGQEGGAIELGRYVDALEFRSIDSLRVDDYFDLARKRIGFPAVSLEDLALEINLGRFGSEFKFSKKANAIYIPMIGRSSVMNSTNDLTLKLQNYAQVVIDPSMSDAIFIAQFLNSELGEKIREWGKSGAVILKLNKAALKKLEVFIPDRATQKKILGIEARLTEEESTLLSLQNDLLELRRELWRNPKSTDTVSNQLSEFSSQLSDNLKEQAVIGLDQWIETIPFPMASILRAWQVTPSNAYKEKYEHLLHFFEATAQFIAVILLSAFNTNNALYEPHKLKLKETLEKNNLSFHRATFGTWKLVVEYLGKQTRVLLQENGKKPEDVQIDRELCAVLFSDSTLKLPSLICCTDVAEILGATNKMRNDWSGHGGVVGLEEAKHRNDELIGQVERLRLAMADVWDNSSVVNALHCRPKKDVIENEIAILKGSNSEFLKESRSMTTSLYVDSLYIISGDQGNALELLPLVQVNTPPGTEKNACYFFNRIERNGNSVRFVSYHFVDRPELSESFEEVVDAINLLSGG